MALMATLNKQVISIHLNAGQGARELASMADDELSIVAGLQRDLVPFQSLKRFLAR